MAGAVAEGKKTMKDFSKKTYQISLGAMLTVLSLLTLYLSAVLPAGQLTLVRSTPLPAGCGDAHDLTPVYGTDQLLLSTNSRCFR